MTAAIPILIPSEPRVETRSIEPARSRFGSPVAAPLLTDAPEVGRIIDKPSPEQLVEIAQGIAAAAQRELEAERKEHARTVGLYEQLFVLYRIELAATYRLINQVIAERAWSAKQQARAVAAEQRADAAQVRALQLHLQLVEAQLLNDAMHRAALRADADTVVVDVPDGNG